MTIVGEKLKAHETATTTSRAAQDHIELHLPTPWTTSPAESTSIYFKETTTQQ